MSKENNKSPGKQTPSMPKLPGFCLIRTNLKLIFPSLRKGLQEDTSSDCMKICKYPELHESGCVEILVKE